MVRASLLAVRMLLTGTRTEIAYEKLRGLPRSFAHEAGQNALAGTVPERSKDDGFEVATFAGGCFWGTELHFMRVPGVKSTCVGYTQGKLQKPTYKEVCSGRSGHTEACQLLFDPTEVSYKELCETLLGTVDPTAENRVGNDFGTQYRHGIYAHSDAQLEAAEGVVRKLQQTLKRPIVTEVRRASVFWPAEQEHQQYLNMGGRNGNGQSAVKGCTEKVRCYG